MAMPLQTIALAGSTGTIGATTAHALASAGYRVLCLGRADFDEEGRLEERLRKEGVTAVISCMASRSGTVADAWRVDYAAQAMLLRAALGAGVSQFVLLSAICVQRPRLAFQMAKLAFERELQAAPLCWTIVRPTAFFKSLSGQISRVRRGKSFLVFGDGRLTACKPISNADLAEYLVTCLDNSQRARRILPIGGPGPALYPMDQVAILERLLHRPIRVRRVPPGLLAVIAWTLGLLGRVIPTLARKAEYARIGHYYATESMLVWDADRQLYDESATPSWGTHQLEDHYRDILNHHEEEGKQR
jgi:divinyl chlorophyllide a 8-vinyl-reductase